MEFIAVFLSEYHDKKTRCRKNYPKTKINTINYSYKKDYKGIKKKRCP